MLGVGVERLLVASSGPDWLALELPAARVSGWLSNEASAGRDPVTAWLERGEQHLHQECPSWRSLVDEEDFYDGDHRDRPAQGDACGGRDRWRRTSRRAS